MKLGRLLQFYLLGKTDIHKNGQLIKTNWFDVFITALKLTFSCRMFLKFALSKIKVINLN